MSADELQELRAARDDFLRLHQDYPQTRISWSVSKDGKLFWALFGDNSTAGKELSNIVPGFIRIREVIRRVGQGFTIKVSTNGVVESVPDPCDRWIHFLINYCGYMAASLKADDILCSDEAKAGTFYSAMEVCAAAVDLLLADVNRQLAEDNAGHRPDEETEPAEPTPVAESTSKSVALFGRQDSPIVRDIEKKTLTKAQYNVVLALLETGDKGLSKDELDRKSGHGDARKVLKRLSDSDSGWQAVISFPVTTGKGYRII